MRYLVTGGAGFIGSHLTEALLAAGHQVVVFDDLSTGVRTNVPTTAEFVEGDIRNYDQIYRACAGVDGVFHCAALPRVQQSIDDPISTHEININGTLNVLLAARDQKVKRVVYSASCAAYGDNPSHVLDETLLPRPLSPYGLQKYVGEHYTRLFALLYGLETVSLRYFNAYGPRMALQGGYVNVMSVFLKQQRLGRPLSIIGTGEQTRDFVYVGDIVRANLAAMTSDKVGQGEVINIGTGAQYSVNQIAEMIGGPIEYLPARVEPQNALADTTLARELLGWQAEMPFDQGLQLTRDWFASLENIPE